MRSISTRFLREFYEVSSSLKPTKWWTYAEFFGSLTPLFGSTGFSWFGSPVPCLVPFALCVTGWFLVPCSVPCSCVCLWWSFFSFLRVASPQIVAGQVWVFNFCSSLYSHLYCPYLNGGTIFEPYCHFYNTGDSSP